MDARNTVAQSATRDVMACIGCNDCLIACPLPQASLVTIAELNHAVEQTVVTNPAVVDFVTACTQCRQCVPACPAGTFSSTAASGDAGSAVFWPSWLRPDTSVVVMS